MSKVVWISFISININIGGMHRQIKIPDLMVLWGFMMFPCTNAGFVRHCSEQRLTCFSFSRGKRMGIPEEDPRTLLRC